MVRRPLEPAAGPTAAEATLAAVSGSRTQSVMQTIQDAFAAALHMIITLNAVLP